jgi:deoxyadenosine/deoxycytidine kinase
VRKIHLALADEDMNIKLTNNTIVEKSPLVVEVIGPAGAGKTTLLRALSQRSKRIQPDIRPSKMRQFPFFISNTVSLLPTYLRRYRHSRWFNRRETRSMAYVKAGLHVLEQQASNNGRVIVLDHGPIYRLAFLRALGPEITTSQPYKRWWASLFDQWTATIDIVVWLDAPNVILLERIRARDGWHTVKETGEQEAFEFLTHYRTFLEQTLAEPVTERRITLLHFDTNQESADQIADDVLATVGSAPNTVVV